MTNDGEIGPTWVLLEALPDDVPSAVRFRRAMKCLLRSFKLRARKVNAVGPDQRIAICGDDDTTARHMAQD